jgi:hypothetical protein
MRRTDQFLTRKPADFDEIVVAVGDHALGVGGGNQPLLGREGPFALCNWLVVTHGFLIRKAFKCCIGMRSDWLSLFFENQRRVAK